MITGFLLVFLAGGVTGAFIATKTARHYLLATSHHGIAAQRMKDRLQTELNLTPEQSAKISPVVEKAAAQLESIRRDTARRVRDTFADMHKQIGPDLSPEQRMELARMRDRHHKFMRRHHHRRDRRMPERPPPREPRSDAY
ncbi:MAG TPA: hypothetical protein VJ719_07040 [Chthoniobacterales bacterium]|nr:hypothetical protein [Chthoniobacterales bacterium]